MSARADAHDPSVADDGALPSRFRVGRTIFWHLDRRHRLRRDALAAAGEAQPFRGRRLHAHSVTLDAGDASDAFDHGFAVRADARRLADQGEVEMDDAPAGAPPADRRHGAGSGRTTRRAIADRTAGNACRCRRRRSCPAARRSAHAGPRRRRNGRPAPGRAGWRRRPASPGCRRRSRARRSRRRCAFPSSSAMSSAVVILRLSSCPSTMTTRSPARSATAASSVRAVASCAASDAAARCAASSLAKRKICGVCARHRPARGTVAGQHAGLVDLLQGVGDRHAQHRAVDARAQRLPGSR